LSKIKDEVFSLRFTKDHADSIRLAAKEQNISPSKAAENMIVNNIDVLNKCFKRQDLIIQRGEIKKLYSRFAKDELDECCKNECGAVFFNGKKNKSSTQCFSKKGC